jgi:phage-related holin
MLSILSKLFAVVKGKLAYIVSMSWAASFLLPLKGFLILTTALVVSDTISGMLAAKRRGEKISSRGFYRTIEKTVVYFAAILCASGLQTMFLSNTGISFLPDVPFVHIVSGSICVTEFLSFRENVESLTGVDILGGLKKNIQKILDAIPTKNSNE